MILFYTKLKRKLRIVFRISYRKFRCECSIYNSTMAIWNRFVTSADFWLVVWILKMHSWLEIKCQTECNNDYDKNKGHAYRFLCDLTFSFRTSNWNNHVYTILHIFEQDFDQWSESWGNGQTIRDRPAETLAQFRLTTICFFVTCFITRSVIIFSVHIWNLVRVITVRVTVYKILWDFFWSNCGIYGDIKTLMNPLRLNVFRKWS